MKQLWLTQDKSNSRPKPLPIPPKPRKPKPSCCGVYLIENQKLNKYYIGMSADMNNRMRQHKNILNKNKCTVKAMQNDWNDHKDQFKFSIIQHADIHILPQLERDLIEQYYGEGKLMYNTVYVVRNKPTVEVKAEYKSCIKKVIETLDKQLITPYELIQQLEKLF